MIGSGQGKNGVVSGKRVIRFQKRNERPILDKVSQKIMNSVVLEIEYPGLCEQLLILVAIAHHLNSH